MRPFIIDDTTKQAIERIKTHAEANVYTIDDLLDIKNGDESLIPGNNPDFTCTLPFGYRVVFTVEAQFDGSRVRHLSMSVDTPGKSPNPIAVQEVMKLAGFEKDLNDLMKIGYVRQEKFGENRYAISVVEKIV
jgi:hypothetical protein